MRKANNIRTQLIRKLSLNQSMRYPEDSKNRILKKLKRFNNIHGTNIRLNVKKLTNNRENNPGISEYYRITIEDNPIFYQFKLTI